MIIQNQPKKKKVKSTKPKLCCPEKHKLTIAHDDHSMINKKLGRFLFTPRDFTSNVIIDKSPIDKTIKLGPIQYCESKII